MRKFSCVFMDFELRKQEWGKKWEKETGGSRCCCVSLSPKLKVMLEFFIGICEIKCHLNYRLSSTKQRWIPQNMQFCRHTFVTTVSTSKLYKPSSLKCRREKKTYDAETYHFEQRQFRKVKHRLKIYMCHFLMFIYVNEKISALILNSFHFTKISYR